MKHCDLASGLSFSLSGDGEMMITMNPKHAPKEWGGEWPKDGLLLCRVLKPEDVQRLKDFMQ